MSTSILYHTNGINGVQYKATRYEKGAVIFEAEMRSGVICNKCGHLYSQCKGKKIRRFRMVPFGNKSCFLDLLMIRQECKKCKYRWWPKLSFMTGKRRMTRSLVNHIIELMRFGTIKAVASFLGISWDTVKDIHKEHLRKTYKNIDYKSLLYIGVDEFSIRKGHDYMTQFTNLETGQIIFAVEGRDQKSIAPFLRKLAQKALNLKAIAMDMSKSYVAAVKETLPHVDYVFDHFHVTAVINKSIEEIRKEQQRKCNKVGLKAIKGMRFLLLMNYENIDPSKESSLNALLAVNKPIATAHMMKEQFRFFWSKSGRKEGAQFLVWWVMDAVRSRIKPLMEAGKTILRHYEGLLNYFDHQISNGITEGINNKIKTLKRQAYGYRDMEYFKLRLYHLHNQGYSLTG